MIINRSKHISYYLYQIFTLPSWLAITGMRMLSLEFSVCRIAVGKLAHSLFILVQAPVGRIFFSGEHTSERFSGYVHGGYFTGTCCFHSSLAIV